MKPAQTLAGLPQNPGVYLFLDKQKTIIYVGKAKNLRKRVESYFREKGKSYKTQVMCRFIADIDYIITDSEVEALLLEDTLIKKHQPRWNILLRDDKSYPYFKVTAKEPFPRLLFVRQKSADGGHYFGPFVFVSAMKTLLDVLNRLFQLRTCHPFPTNLIKPCMEYDLGHCSAPCTGYIGEEEYRDRTQEMVRLLRGDWRPLREILLGRIADAAERFHFEKASRYKNLLDNLHPLLSRQKMVLPAGNDLDIMVGAHGGHLLSLDVFIVRDGRLLFHRHFHLENVPPPERREAMRRLIEKFYLDQAGQDPPAEILVNDPNYSSSFLEKWLADRRGAMVPINKPRQGVKREYLDLLEKNCRFALEKLEFNRQAALEELKSTLGLNTLPRVIEGFDVSHLQGHHKIASLIHCREGRLKKENYRLFLIREVVGNDDYGSLREAVQRRLRRLEKENPQGLPDLLLIDGGLGQVNAVAEIIPATLPKKPAIVGLAKREELLFRPGHSEPIALDRRNLGLQLLIRIRDECHRFALANHRRRREKFAIRSPFLELAGVGPVRAEILGRHYHSLSELFAVTPEEATRRTGLSRKFIESLFPPTGDPERRG